MLARLRWMRSHDAAHFQHSITFGSRASKVVMAECCPFATCLRDFFGCEVTMQCIFKILSHSGLKQAKLSWQNVAPSPHACEISLDAKSRCSAFSDSITFGSQASKVVMAECCPFATCLRDFVGCEVTMQCIFRFYHIRVSSKQSCHGRMLPLRHMLARLRWMRSHDAVHFPILSHSGLEQAKLSWQNVAPSPHACETSLDAKSRCSAFSKFYHIRVSSKQSCHGRMLPLRHMLARLRWRERARKRERE